MPNTKANPDIAAERLRAYLRDLPPQKQSELLRQIDEQSFGDLEISSAKFIEHELRCLLRTSAYQQDRLGNPARQFFKPLEPYLVDGLPDRSKGEITRACLRPIWAWISHDLMPDATRDYTSSVKTAAHVSDANVCERKTRAFQEKFIDFAGRALATPDCRLKALRQLVSYMAPDEPLKDLARVLIVVTNAVGGKPS